MGEVFQLTAGSRSVSVKRLFAHHPLTEDLAVWMSGFADRCRSVGVPSPRNLVGRDGRLLQVDSQGDRWRCLDWVPGQTPDRHDVAAACWLAEQAARIHGLAEAVPEGAQLHPFYRESRLDWAALADRADGTCRGEARWLARRLADRADEFTRLGWWVSSVPVGHLTMTHNDLKVGNTVVDGDRRWLLDWEQAGPGVSWRELGLIGIHFIDRPAGLRRIGAAYRAAGGAPWPGDRSVFATGLCVWLNFLSLQIDVLLDPAATDADRGFAEPVVRGLLRDIPGFSALDAAAAQIRP